MEKVEKDITTSIAVSPIWRVVIMYAVIFKTQVIVSISK
jgi:hypothetical protein